MREVLVMVTFHHKDGNREKNEVDAERWKEVF